MSLLSSQPPRWFLQGLRAIALLLPCLTPTYAASTLSWTNTLLTVTHPKLPGGRLDIWYLEAFCRSGGHDRSWDKTRVPHRTELLQATPDGSELRFRTLVPPNVEVLHEVIVRDDGLDFNFLLTNRGTQEWDIQWFQPACVRVAAFTGCDQSSYTRRSFVFTPKGLTLLSDMERTTRALYTGGQVFLPQASREIDANPRPVARNPVSKGLIGCFSADDQWILAIASDRTFELFEGVYVCLHSDPLIEGLKPGESKRLRQKIYLVPNDPDALVRRHQLDFPESKLLPPPQPK